MNISNGDVLLFPQRAFNAFNLRAHQERGGAATVFDEAERCLRNYKAGICRAEAIKRIWDTRVRWYNSGKVAAAAAAAAAAASDERIRRRSGASSGCTLVREVSKQAVARERSL